MSLANARGKVSADECGGDVGFCFLCFHNAATEKQRDPTLRALSLEQTCWAPLTEHLGPWPQA